MTLRLAALEQTMNYGLAPLAGDSAATRAFLGLAAAGTMHELRAPEGTAGHAALAARALAAWPWAAPILWVGADMYPPGLAAAGLDPARCLFAEARDEAQKFAALEVALRGGMAGVAEVSACTRLAARRLALAARQGGSLGFVLRHAPARTATDCNAFASRWLITPAPGGRLLAERLYVKGGQPEIFLLEMETDHGTAPALDLVATNGLRRAG